jgi:hypothetical protein
MHLEIDTEKLCRIWICNKKLFNTKFHDLDYDENITDKEIATASVA